MTTAPKPGMAPVDTSGLRQSILYLLDHTDRLTELGLNGVIFYAEYLAAVEGEPSITGVGFIKDHKGPFSYCIGDEARNLVKEGSLQQVRKEEDTYFSQVRQNETPAPGETLVRAEQELGHLPVEQLQDVLGRLKLKKDATVSTLPVSSPIYLQSMWLPEAEQLDLDEFIPWVSRLRD